MVARAKTRKKKPARRPAVRVKVPHGCCAPKDIPRCWSKLIKQIPKYDCFRQADGCFFDPEAAQDVIDFYETVLTHSEGSGVANQPFVLEDWQKAILANLFGWKKYDSKGRVVRRYRTLFLYVPRKNGKTPFAAGLCLYMLVCDGEPGAQIAGAASCEKQASPLYRHACGMVRNSAALRKRCRIFQGRGSLSIKLRSDPNSHYEVFTSSPTGKHGGNPHLILVDELHEITDREMIDAFETSFISDNRTQSMMVYITTADYDRVSICNDKHKKAVRVRDNDGDPSKPGYDPSFLPVIYETEKGANWKSEKVWIAANPNWGVSVSVDKFRQRVREVIENPTEIPEFLRVNLNMITQTAKFWLDLKHWDATAETLDIKRIAGQRCFGALDLASVSDLTSFTLLFPHEKEGDFSILQKLWVPEETIRFRTERDSIPYGVWVDQEWISTTPGNSTDYAVVRSEIRELAEDFGIKTIAIDPKFQGEECAQQLMADGFDVVKHGQGYWSYAAPTKRFEQLYLGRKFRHAGNPVMRWMMGNAMYEIDDAGNKKPSKKKSSEKIDGVVTLIMAIGAYLEGVS